MGSERKYTAVFRAKILTLNFKLMINTIIQYLLGHDNDDGDVFGVN